MISGSRLLHHSSAFTIDRPLIEAWMPHLPGCSAERHEVEASRRYRKKKRTKKHPHKAKTPYEKDKQGKAKTPYVWKNRFPRENASQEPENTLLAAPRKWSSTPATTSVPATQQHHKREKQKKQSSTSTSTKAEHHPVTRKRPAAALSAAELASDPYYLGVPVPVITYAFKNTDSVDWPLCGTLFRELTRFERSVVFRPPGRELWRGLPVGRTNRSVVRRV